MRGRRHARRIAATSALVTPNLRHFRGIDVTETVIDGETVLFATNAPRDPIQGANRKGQFFEAAELALLRDLIPVGGHFVDIGANVGNHTIFAGLFLKAARIIPFEPNPPVIDLLRANVALNRLTGIVDLSFLGLGLGETNVDTYGLHARAVNLGATKMRPGAGNLQVRRGDDLLAGERIDAMKIDVEGMEMAVLRGLEQVIAANRPVIMIEVPNEHEAEFQPWVSARNYRIVHALPHYEVLTNYMMVAAEK